MDEASIHQAMQRAIALSIKGLGKTSPNPVVGAVIIDESGLVISEGFHDRTQSPDHAEIVALKFARAAARGATLVVTLEPCNHLGKTGPCSQAIIEAGISQVIYAVADPNPVAGGGSVTLRAAGVNVIGDVLTEEARYVNRAWLTTIEKRRPFFSWKVAATLDGKVAATDGTSKWITNETSRADVQKLRRQSDAILVGTNTVIADDPHLIPRGFFAGYVTNPTRVICGERTLPTNARIFDDAAPTMLVQSRDLDYLVQELNKAQCHHVFVEAGPTLASAMLERGLLDELIVYQAPSLLGEGRNFVEGFGITTIEARLKLTHLSTQLFEGDIKSVYRITTKSEITETNETIKEGE
jgi:diaminohydroxyphosphoribosylaminopyrimidine deaminase/5-amino-6-(5-phosphoribosylamino)uracil reductase